MNHVARPLNPLLHKPWYGYKRLCVVQPPNLQMNRINKQLEKKNKQTKQTSKNDDHRNCGVFSFRSSEGGMVSASVSGTITGSRPDGEASPKSSEAQAWAVPSPPRNIASAMAAGWKYLQNPRPQGGGSLAEWMAQKKFKFYIYH